MKILAVDDEEIALKNLEFKLRDCAPDAVYQPYADCTEAIAYAKAEKPDVAFLDINMRPMDGIELAKNLREACPTCAIIFLTGYSEYAVQAFAMKVNGYLMKPVDSDDLKRELDFLTEEKPQEEIKPGVLQVQCFGNFEVYMDGKVLKFSRNKSKELLAYLIDRRGSSATMAEIASALWADGMYDRSRNNQIHTFMHDMIKVLEDAGAGDVIVRGRNATAVDREKIDCDYYRFLQGDVQAINSYFGEYMAQYWWAEFTAGELYNMKNQ